MSKPLTGTRKKALVQTWLEQEGWQIKEILMGGNTTWALLATNNACDGLLIVQLREPADMLLIQTTVGPDDALRRQFEALDESLRHKTLWNIRLGLIQLGVDFEGVEDPLRKVTINQRIYDDGLTKDNFTQRVTRVKNSVFYVHWSIAKVTQQPPPGNQTDSLPLN